ncbi:FAD binding domain-containing protein [Alkaliphilus pronyensis]|uniref:FAD binding domain-containing protein n=1 Tax=Alkaliphilus pronyensis TaxID=1482732 RepID=UPI001A9BA345|nr:FAD binding domain-containing protein [Alkaliphilus pronyensis]
MITIKNYIFPSTLEEAYGHLISNKNATLIGGGAFIRMGSKNISTAIDLSKCGLNSINELKESIEIGAMVTLGEIEASPILNKNFNNMLSNSVKEIVGVQLRNIATVGATVYSKYGFSDFNTALMVLDTKVKLYKGGIIPLEAFMAEKVASKDILQSIIIKSKYKNVSFKSMRNSRGDYAILNIAVSKNPTIKIAVGARPGRAVLAYNTMEYISNYGVNNKNLKDIYDIISNEIVFGSNSRGSSQYRQAICKVLLKKALLEVGYLEA